MKLKLIEDNALPIETDCIILPYIEDKDVLNESLSNIVKMEDKRLILNLIDNDEISSKLNSIFYLPTSTTNILIVGLGKLEELDDNKIRQAAGKVLKSLKRHKKKNVTLDIRTPILRPSLFIEGFALGQYDFKQYKEDKEQYAIENLHIAINDPKVYEEDCNKALLICNASNWAREIADTPANDMTPTKLVDKAKEVAKANKVKIKVLNEKQMTKLGMGSFMSVSQGSDEEGKMILMHYTHPKAAETIALVGKGVTFDAGGISLKPGKGMEEMKYDMCGASNMLGAFKAITELKPQVNIVCTIPTVENMPSSKATKPGDVVTAYNGKTIEVHNTDAEGRLILADAISYTIEQYKPDYLIDAATLTGAVIMALGHNLGAVLGNDQQLIDDLIDSGKETHERLWQLPFLPEYVDVMKGKVADLCNIGAGGAGTVTAGCFISNFVTEDVKWAHLDIAGVAWGMKGAEYINPKLASGFGVRLLTDFVLNKSN